MPVMGVWRDTELEAPVAVVRAVTSSNAIGPSPFIRAKALVWPLSILLGVVLVLQGSRARKSG